MLDILLAFMAVVGIAMLGTWLMDVLYFKKRLYSFPLIVDLRQRDLEEAWDMLASISQAQKYPGGKTVSGELIVLTSPENLSCPEELVFHYLRVFGLSGTVFNNDDAWLIPYQNTPVKEGTNPS